MVGGDCKNTTFSFSQKIFFSCCISRANSPGVLPVRRGLLAPALWEICRWFRQTAAEAGARRGGNNPPARRREIALVCDREAWPRSELVLDQTECSNVIQSGSLRSLPLPSDSCRLEPGRLPAEQLVARLDQGRLASHQSGQQRF